MPKARDVDNLIPMSHRAGSSSRHGEPWLSAAMWALGGVLSLGSCADERAAEPTPATYRDEVASVFERRCVSCHAKTSPEGGWRAGSYLDAIACVGGSDVPATLPSDERAPILRALDTDVHRGLLESGER